MASTLQLKRTTAANWTALNTVLAEGEIGIETDTLEFKIGDGVTAWTSLAYAGGGTGTVTSVGQTVPTGFSVSGSPITGSGTLAITYAGGYQGYTSAEASKLSGIATGATANSADSFLLDRTNHTGTQSVATITGLAAIATSGSASDLSAGTLPAARFDDTAHGARAGGTLHSDVVAGGAAGFMTGADKTKLDGVATGATANTGTVTSVAVSGSDGIEVDSGSPVTTTGTIALGLSTATLGRLAPTPLTWGGSTTTRLSPFLGVTTGARISLAPTNDRLFYLVGRPTGRVRVSDPTVELVTGAASTTCRVGLCEWDTANGQPGALLVDWGTVNTTSAGTIGSFSNGTATVDLDPTKAYALMFIAGGGVATAFYYPPFAPEAVPLYIQGVTPMIISIYDSSEGAQRTGGFNNPPSAFAALTVETAASATGWRNFFMLNVVPTP